MGRLIGIDFGLKRVGIAVTDVLKIIASPLETVEREKILDFLKDYIGKEEVEGIVIGWPKDLLNQDTDATPAVEAFVKELEKNFPELPIHKEDERFTSKMAVRAMVEGGMKKKDRQNKGNIDKISASIILQTYLDFEKL